MKKSYITLFILLIGWYAGAQQIHQEAIMTFEKSAHDFGTVREDVGLVEYDFFFINTGNIPLKIENVKASCGCTTPAWTKDDIIPGDSGFIKIQYNPLNRPGPFNKTITVTSNAEPNVSVLAIEGNVLPKPETIADEFPHQIGNLRFRYKILNMGNITTRDTVFRKFPVYNDGQSIIVFSERVVGPDHIRVEFEPKILTPGRRGNITLTYDPAIKGELGFSSDNIIIFTNEKEDSNKQFNVYATVEEYFPPLREEELAVAPKITFDKTIHDFGSLEQGKVVDTEFLFYNEGKQDLNIRQAKAVCNCTAIKLEKETIGPGESAKILVEFDTSAIIGNQQKSIVLFTNDPKAPTRVLTLKARVED